MFQWRSVSCYSCLVLTPCLNHTFMEGSGATRLHQDNEQTQNYMVI